MHEKLPRAETIIQVSREQTHERRVAESEDLQVTISQKPNVQEAVKLTEVRERLARHASSKVSLAEAFNSEERQYVIDAYEKLKTTLSGERLGIEVKKFFQDPEVSMVLARVKPVSYLQPQMEVKRLGLLTQQSGLTADDIEDCKKLFGEFGVETAFCISEELLKVKAEQGVELMHIYNRDYTLQVMAESSLFSPEEIAYAKADMGEFLNTYMSAKNPVNGYSGASRIGVLYGYPLEDVRDFMEYTRIKEKYGFIGKADSVITDEIIATMDPKEQSVIKRRKEKKSIAFQGENGAINWVSTNLDSVAVMKRMAEINEALAIEKKIMHGSKNNE